MCYLMLSVAGHLTFFLTRTRGPFWSIRPATIVWVAVVGTQIVATLIAVYGFLMPALGWKWAGFVWAYALIWALVSDRVKLLAYRIFDPVKADTPHQAKAEPKPETKDEPKPETKTPSEVTPQRVKRVHELYEELGREEVRAVQDWEQAQRTIPKAAPDEARK